MCSYCSSAEFPGSSFLHPTCLRCPAGARRRKGETPFSNWEGRGSQTLRTTPQSPGPPGTQDGNYCTVLCTSQKFQYTQEATQSGGEQPLRAGPNYYQAYSGNLKCQCLSYNLKLEIGGVGVGLSVFLAECLPPPPPRENCLPLIFLPPFSPFTLTPCPLAASHF